jgi:ubiquinone/menaquinone biosynthesis C-methylase UbiE
MSKQKTTTKFRKRWERINTQDLQPSSFYVLDIGSGDKPHPEATHLCDLHVNSCTERAGVLRTDGRPFVRCTIDYLPFKDNSFVFDYACHVLEHSGNPVLALSELTRVSSKGYVETPTKLSERLYGWSFHRWVISFKKGKFFYEPKGNENVNRRMHELYARNLAVRRLDEICDYIFSWHYLRVVWKKNGWNVCFEKANLNNRRRVLGTITSPKPNN